MEAWPTGVGIAEQIFNLFMSLDSEGQDAMLRDIDRSVAETNSTGPASLDDIAPSGETTELSSFQCDTVSTSVLAQTQTSENPELFPFSPQFDAHDVGAPAITNKMSSGKGLNEDAGPGESQCSGQGHDKTQFGYDGGIYCSGQATSGDRPRCASRPPAAATSARVLRRETSDYDARIASKLFEDGTAEHHVYNVQPRISMQAVEAAERALQFLDPFLPPVGSPASFEPGSVAFASSAGPNVTMPSARAPFMDSRGVNIPVADAEQNSEAGPSRTEQGSVNKASGPYDVETRTCLLKDCKQFNKSFKNKKDFWRHVKSTRDHKGQVGSAAGPKCSTCGEVFSRYDSLGRNDPWGSQLSRRLDAVALA